ncbi:putative RNA polymerase II subunit B1 CTD phosphatase RPAP2 [Stegodyphus dumicola]|uniref:putative RNA polymerase II subunit B1 CTD phosphatase RPAP2 n=1 Tax=Stegodyphus dumicola TaxID=202533 RepID=UPI0015A99316|nr:putative RNA polymerase II subunit B1 CTD phosphatase RPAP2 [Stegodyphus dumicola]
MAPVTNGKSIKPNEKCDSARQKQILSAREKVLKIKRSILKIVEALLEEDVSKEWLANCTKLCQNDYDDVIQERSIEHMCGYPLCSKRITQVPKQKYHISRFSNKVYDLTERKCFCSNACYKASNFVKAQLSPVPLYMRKEETIVVNLLSDCDNKGSAGEEILFHHKIDESEIEKVYTEKRVTNNLSDILKEEIKKCSDKLSDLKIKENVYKNPYVFADPAEENHALHNDDNSNSNSSASDEGSEESDEDKKLFPDYDNMKVLSHKHMPIPQKTSKTKLISPIKPTEVSKAQLNNMPIEFIQRVFQDWITEDTMKYILGEKQIYSIKADLLFQSMHNSSSYDTDKLSSMKDEYINLCLKLDRLPEEEEDDSDSVEITIEGANPPERHQTASNDSEPKEETVSKPEIQKSSLKKRPRRKTKGKSKSVAFASADKEKKSISKPSTSFKEVEEPSMLLVDPAFPLIDSVSQNGLRRQVLTSKLKAVYFDMLPLLGLHYKNIRDSVKQIVDTFSLTPTNIIYKPKEWKVIALVLFRILTKTVLEDLHDEDKLLKLSENPIIPVRICIQEIEKLVTDLISPRQLQRLQGLCEKVK